MKSTSFFISKSETLINQIKSIELIDFDFDGNSKFQMQIEELNNLEFQIKLMLSEFDNGFLFIEKLSSFNNKGFFSNHSFKEHLMNLLAVFIDFLNEYRS